LPCPRRQQRRPISDEGVGSGFGPAESGRPSGPSAGRAISPGAECWMRPADSARTSR
jgi:hypothetical protein